MRLPVHCCCDPGRRFGYMDVPPYVVAGMRLRLRLGGVFGEPVDAEIMRISLVLWPARLLSCGHLTTPLMMRCLAIKSMELPVETLLASGMIHAPKDYM